MELLLGTHNLLQLVDKPTHRDGHILDWIVVRDDDSSIDCVDVLDKGFSDHFFVFFKTSMLKPKCVKKKVQYRNIKGIDHQSFSTDIQTQVNSMSHDAN